MRRLASVAAAVLPHGGNLFQEKVAAAVYVGNGLARPRASSRSRSWGTWRPDRPLFLAAVESVEEAVYNSLLRATDVSGRAGRRCEAIPIGRLRELLRSSMHP